MVTAKKSEQRRSRKVVTDKGLERFLPTGVQKSYFMLYERKILNIALEKYRPGQSEPILVGGEKATAYSALPVKVSHLPAANKIRGYRQSETKRFPAIEFSGIRIYPVNQHLDGRLMVANLSHCLEQPIQHLKAQILSPATKGELTHDRRVDFLR